MNLSNESSVSLYWLGKNSFSSSHFRKFHELVQRCSNLGQFITFDNESELLSCYESDAQTLSSRIPMLVFLPQSIECIAPFIKICSEMAISVTPRGGGTGLMGGCIVPKEGVLLLTGGLKAIREYNPLTGTATLDPGVTINQLNQAVEDDGWIFPLEMASNGVATIAGCLSVQARGYHQQEYSFYDCIQNVLIINKEGDIQQVPFSVVCGAEGAAGIIIEIKIQLIRKPNLRITLKSKCLLQDALNLVTFFRSIQVIRFVFYSNEQIYIGLEGEEWRMKHAINRLKLCFKSDLISLSENQEFIHFFLPSSQSFVMITSVFYTTQLINALEKASDLANKLELQWKMELDLLSGTIHLIIESKKSQSNFKTIVEDFLIKWIDFIKNCGGVLASCHGLGWQMRPYINSFCSEETQRSWSVYKI